MSVAQTSGSDSTWRDHDRAARAARARGDWADARTQLVWLNTMLKGHPRYTVALARAYARLGDTAAAIATLGRFADMGLAYPVAEDTSMGWLRGAPAAAPLRARLLANVNARGRFTDVATLPTADFVAEGIAWDAKRARFLVSSVRHGTVVAVSRAGAVTPFVDILRDGGTTPLGLALDAARDRLWVAMNYFPTTEHAPKADSGRAGVMSFDLASGRALRRMELSRGAHQTGDICLASTGDLYVSDGNGAVYVARAGADSLALLVPQGELVSPQGCAVDRDDRTLFVADYLLGVAAVDVASGRFEWMPHPPNTGLAGTDGLLLDGDRLIGVQNAWDPHRVLEMQLDRAHRTIVATRVLAQDTARIVEPTHVVRVDGDVYFIANGGFGKYDNDGVLRAGVTQDAPRIGRIATPHPVTISVDTARTKRALLAADAELARRAQAGGLRAFLDAFTPDGALEAPGQPIVLPSTFRGGVAPATASLGFTWTAMNAIANADGKFGCTYGSVSYAPTASDTAGARSGVYATCWRYGDDGRWAVVAHNHNARGPVGGTPPIPAVMPRSATVSVPGDAAGDARWSDAAFALLASGANGPGPAFSAFVADDGILFAAPSYPAGPAGTARAFEGWPAERQLAWAPAYAFGGGGLAVTVGNAETLTRATGASESPSHYFTIWRQRADGRWEFVLDFGSAR